MAAIQVDLCAHQPVYGEALTGFCHVYRPSGLNIALLSQGFVLETAIAVGIVGRKDVPRAGEGGEASGCWGPARWNGWSHYLNYLLQQITIVPIW